MLSCKQTAELLSRGLDEHLPLTQRMALRIHMLMCRACRQYEKQLHFIRRAARRLSQATEHGDQAATPLSPEARERIRYALKQNMD